MSLLAVFILICWMAGPFPAVAQEPSASPDDGAQSAGEQANTAGAEGTFAGADSSGNDPLTWSRPGYIYNSVGRRDPFNSLVPEESTDEKKIKGLFNYEKGFLRGIVRTEGGAYALAVDGDNYGHVLRENDPVYGGRVARITDEAVYLHIVKYGRAMNIVLRMDTARQTVRSDEEYSETVRRPGITLSYGGGELSGSSVSIGEVALPSHTIRTVEETWFGDQRSDAPELDRAGSYLAYLLLSPPNNTGVQLPQILRWTRSPQDSLYTVVVAEDSSFARPVFVKEGITASSFLLEKDPGLETDRPLYWKVIATSRTGKLISFRNNLSFRIVR